MTTAVVTTTAELASVVDQQRPRIEANNRAFTDSEWPAIRAAIVDGIVPQLPAHGPANVNFDTCRIAFAPCLRGFEEEAQTDWEIVAANYELARELDQRREAIARRSRWRFTDDEWDQILPGLITSFVEHLPAGDHVALGALDVRVSRGPIKKKTIQIQKSPDGLTSTATITETA